jgi:hypothetical protein
MATAADWWVVVPPSEAGASSIPKDAQIISTTPGTPSDSTLGQDGTITIAGKQWTRFLGPYPSQQAAQTAAPESGLQYIGTLIGVAAGAAAEGATQPGNSSLPGAAGAAGGAAVPSVLGFLSGLTSANLWIRVAKVIAGGVILIVGLVKLTGLDSKAPAIVQTAVKAAPLL